MLYLDLLGRFGSDSVEILWSIIGAWETNKRAFSTLDAMKHIRGSMILEIIFSEGEIEKPLKKKRGSVAHVYETLSAS